jgi:DNA polymerase-3 subunit delta
VTGLTYNMVRRLRDAVAVAEQLQAGQNAAQVKKTLRMPPRAADKFLKDVAARDVTALRRGLAALADLELESRGGGGGVLSEDTAALRAVLSAAV